MKMLALELSSRRGSLAVLSGAAVMAECEWSEEGRQSRGLFRRLPDLCARAGVALEEFDLLAPGRGPGAYTGLRLAMTVARSVALPGQRTVYPVGSGEALAWEIMEEEDAGLVAVLGDARRGQLWVGLFEQTPAGPRARLPWAVAKPLEAAHLIPSEAVTVSSDLSILSCRAEFEPLRKARWIEADRFPQARWVGALAWHRFSRGLPPEPATPIYMHPAVAAAPSSPH